MPPPCTACASDLHDDTGTWSCPEGHTFTAMSLALATNAAALRALWAAVRALEDDAAALNHLADRDDVPPLARDARRREAAAALHAAAVLRGHADDARQRVAALERDDRARAGAPHTAE